MSNWSLRLALVGFLLIPTGCSSMWHELQPHRLKRLNRGPAPSWDPEFTSQRDPLKSADAPSIMRAQSPAGAPSATAATVIE